MRSRSMSLSLRRGRSTRVNAAGIDKTVVLLEYEVGSLTFEFNRKDTALFGHLTPQYSKHSCLDGWPES